MNIIIHYTQVIHDGIYVECYAKSFVRELRSKGHGVVCVGEGHIFSTFSELNLNEWDYLIDLDNGRNTKGELPFVADKVKSIPKAVWFIDSHGQPDLHESIAKHYNHVFFAVWDKRDLFANHQSAHWLPNCTDKVWFDKEACKKIPLQYDFGFFGSKGGLHRADGLKTICEILGLTYDIRQISKAHRHKWPYFAEAMMACGYLFNHGQKHDGPNQRVFESLVLDKPLLCDLDPRSGLEKVLENGKHFIGFEDRSDHSDLQEKVKWMLTHPTEVIQIAKNGYNETVTKHLIGNRVDSLLEVMT